MFTEEKLKLDSIRKASAELAEKQKQIWLEQTKEEADADEKNSTASYEFIVRVDNRVNFHPAIPGDLQKTIEVVTNAEKELAENPTGRNRSHPRNRAFTFTIAPPDNSKSNKQKPVHRSINTRKNQKQVISL